MNKNIIKIALLILITAVIASFFYFNLGQYATLDYLKSQQENLGAYYADHKLFVMFIFFIGYVIVTALSLPAAAILTLLGGALFGFGFGLILVSFSSSIGATLAFLMSRFFLKDAIQNKYSKQLSKINAGLEKEGAFYLFAMRLVPAFPFFIVNLVMGVLSIRTWTFYWVSQIGKLAGTAVYVYAGTQLGQISSLKDIASPRLILAFALLGILPIASKKLLTLIRKEKS